jgi:hypothetical protein
MTGAGTGWACRTWAAAGTARSAANALNIVNPFLRPLSIANPLISNRTIPVPANPTGFGNRPPDASPQHSPAFAQGQFVANQSLSGAG